MCPPPGYGDDDSRTPSPSPSSGVESSSMKDSPMQIELGGDTTSIGECELNFMNLLLGILRSISPYLTSSRYKK